MWEALERLFAGNFMPHGHCYLWSPEMVWLQVISNLLIGTAYVSISSTLYVIIRRIKDVPFSWMFVAFGVFIITCGGTHFLDVATVWHPIYWLDGGLRAVTAAASVGTALLLVRLVPKAVSLAGAAEVAHQRGKKLESTFAELAEAHEKTKELERLKAQFFANVSHELRTPLTLVLGPAERLLSTTTLTSEQRHDIELITRNARTLLKHVNDLLDVAKLEAGKMELDYARLDLAHLVRVSASHFDGFAAERKVNVILDAPPKVALEGDADKLQRLVLNLLSNAFKVTPPGGTIRTTITTTETSARIEIADSGPGIEPAMRTRVFERFAQGDTSRRGGTGLGLSIALEFAELHGGSITVRDAQEGGASFSVELPLRAPEGVAVRDALASEGESPDANVLALATTNARGERPIDTALPSSGTPRPTVLVVEDDPELNAFVTEVLAVTYRVEQAFDGDEGLAKARALRPDAILTDMMMPRRSGDELVHAIRKDPQLDDIPIVLLTAKSDPELRTRMLREGAQDYLTKPFSAEELLARIGNLVALAKLKLAHERESEASKLKSGFLGLVSHELRTPLTAIQLLIDRLSEGTGGDIPQRQKLIIERLAAAAARLTDLVDTLLHSARIQSGYLAVNIEAFDLGALASQAAEEVRPQAQRKSLTLEAEPTEDRVRIESDPKLVRLVLVNLVSNAIKFTQAGGVTLHVESVGDRRVVRITDTGPGIAPEEQERIFRPFQQLEPTTNKHLPGVGLGLSLVRQIVDNLGAHIIVRSEVGKGSTFEVSFPAIPPGASGRPRGL